MEERPDLKGRDGGCAVRTPERSFRGGLVCVASIGASGSFA